MSRAEFLARNKFNAAMYVMGLMLLIPALEQALYPTYNKLMLEAFALADEADIELI